MIEQWADKLNNIADVRAYREEAARKSDFERTELNKDKTGVKLEGVAAINPVNGKQIPIFVSDYVLMGYGTGAIMAVPAHDTRDWEFRQEVRLRSSRSFRAARTCRRLRSPQRTRPASS